jgi:hypothetical protein
MKFFTVIIICLFVISCTKPEKDLTLDVKIIEYNLTKENNKNMLMFRPNSIGYKLKVTVKNNTNQDTKFWAMSCSYQQDFTTNHSDALIVSLLPVNCNANYPITYDLKQGEQKDFDLYIFKDNNITDKRIINKISKTKIGLIIRAETNDFRKNFDDYLDNEDSKKFIKIIWSNEINLSN